MRIFLSAILLFSSFAPRAGAASTPDPDSPPVVRKKKVVPYSAEEKAEIRKREAAARKAEKAAAKAKARTEAALAEANAPRTRTVVPVSEDSSAPEASASDEGSPAADAPAASEVARQEAALPAAALAAPVPAPVVSKSPPPQAPAKKKPAAKKKKNRPSQLERDLAFYRRTASEKGLGANDRLYILHVLRAKHADAKVPLAPLDREISKWEKVRREGGPSSPAPAPVPAAPVVAAPDLLPAPTAGEDPFPAVLPAPAPHIEALPAETMPAFASTPPDYVLRAGDILDVQVRPTSELSRECVIQPDGTLVFPLVGPLQAVARPVEDVERDLVRRLRLYVARPEVRVTIKKFSDDNIFLVGKVSRPGPVSFRVGLKLLQAVSAAGGFTDDADRTAVRVYRGKEGERMALSVNAAEILAGGDLSRDLLLQPGDIVEVERGGRQVSVMGMVAKPGSYPCKEGFTLLELVSAAGGLAPGAKTGRVYIFRRAQEGREALWVNLARVMAGHPEDDAELEPGDIVMVPQRAFSSGSGALSSLTPWFYAATIVLAVVVASGGND